MYCGRRLEAIPAELKAKRRLSVGDMLIQSCVFKHWTCVCVR